MAPQAVGIPPLGYHLSVPPQIAHRSLLVLVHGIHSHPASLLRRFAQIGRQHGIVLLAPDFSDTTFRGYQRLAAGKLADGAARALEDLAHSVAGRFGLDQTRFDLAGFSGGAQFVHRFAMTRPERVRTAVVAAAGWYTLADLAQAFPHGLGGRGGERELRAFLALPLHVAVGQLDLSRDASLRRGPELDAQQGRNRLERARFWAAHIAERARQLGIRPDVSLSLLEATGHHLREAVQRGGFDRTVADFVLAGGRLTDQAVEDQFA